MFEKMTIEQYNEILSSKSATPGGGSALAIVGAMACSLVEMSANVTLTKMQEGEDNYRFLQDNAAFLARARKRLQQLSNDDAQAFQHIIESMHLPKDTAEQAQIRLSTLQKAYHKAALVPLDVMRTCKEALSRAKLRIQPLLYKYVASDCVIGEELLETCIKFSMENVYANTTLIKDENLRKMLENQGTEILSQINK